MGEFLPIFPTHVGMNRRRLPDTYILLDDAQVVKGTYQYRNIFLCNGDAKFITLPLNLKLGMNFNELTFSNDNWKNDHLNRFYNYYHKAPHFEQIYSELKNFYNQEFKKPIDLLKKTMFFCFEKLDIKTELLVSSNFNVDGTKGDMVLNLCKAAGAEIYMAGQGSYDYMQEYLEKFQKSGIKIKWHSFHHPVYEQNPRYPFTEGLGCLDIFFFKGYGQSKKIFWRNINNNE